MIVSLRLKALYPSHDTVSDGTAIDRNVKSAER